MEAQMQNLNIVRLCICVSTLTVYPVTYLLGYLVYLFFVCSSNRAIVYNRDFNRLVVSIENYPS